MKPPSKKKDTSIDALGRTYHPGEPLPAPEVDEKNTDTAWDIFQALQDGTHQDFPTTTRETLDARRHPRLAKAALKPLTMEEVMFEARRNNRVCPLPSHWQRLQQLLRQQAGTEPPPPIEVAAWRSIPSLNKRLCLRNQVQWAWEHRVLEAMFAFLRDLPEDKWHHMGD